MADLVKSLTTKNCCSQNHRGLHSCLCSYAVRGLSVGRSLPHSEGKFASLRALGTSRLAPAVPPLLLRNRRCQPTQPQILSLPRKIVPVPDGQKDYEQWMQYVDWTLICLFAAFYALCISRADCPATLRHHVHILPFHSSRYEDSCIAGI